MALVERRRFVRLNVLPLLDTVITKCSYLDKEKASLTMNISKGGICIILYEEIRTLDVLDLKINLPGDDTPIEAIGRVVWVKEVIISKSPKSSRFEAGIEFIKINEEDKKRIGKYILFIIKNEIGRLEREEGITTKYLEEATKQIDEKDLTPKNNNDS